MLRVPHAPSTEKQPLRTAAAGTTSQTGTDGEAPLPPLVLSPGLRREREWKLF